MTVVPTMFGDRAVLFVRYPAGYTGQEILEQMGWAYETKRVYELGPDGFLIAVFAKEHYLESFIRTNEEWIIPHKYDAEFGTFEVEDLIYEA